MHPGGRKILEAIEKALGLQPDHNCFAYEVLRDYGNMSSATVLFVLKEVWNQLASGGATFDADRPNILSCAFGPGLTLESMVLEAVMAEPEYVPLAASSASARVS